MFVFSEGFVFVAVVFLSRELSTRRQHDSRVILLISDQYRRCSVGESLAADREEQRERQDEDKM